MRRLAFNLFIGCALVISLSSCDSGNGDDGDDGGNNNNNSFQASVTVSGDATDSFSGFAVFAEDGDGDGGFLIYIYQGQFSTIPTGRIVAFGHDTDSPAEGTFQIDDSDSYGTYASDLGNFAGTFVTGESGQVTISSLSSDRMSGSFTFTGELVQNSAIQGTATVSGTFTAERLSAGVIPTF